MRKITATLLALVMLLAVCAPAAFADEKALTDKFFKGGKISAPLRAPYIQNVNYDYTDSDVYLWYDIPEDVVAYCDEYGRLGGSNKIAEKYGVRPNDNVHLQVDMKVDGGDWASEICDFDKLEYDTAAGFGDLLYPIEGKHYAFFPAREEKIPILTLYWSTDDWPEYTTPEFLKDIIVSEGGHNRLDLANHTLSVRYRMLLEYEIDGFEGTYATKNGNVIWGGWSPEASIGKNGTQQALTKPATLDAPTISDLSCKSDEVGYITVNLRALIPQSAYDLRRYYDVTENYEDINLEYSYRVDGGEWQYDGWHGLSGGSDSIHVENVTEDSIIDVRCRVVYENTDIASPWSNTLTVNGVNATRISGKGRIDTALQISRDGWESSDYAVLAYAMNYPDALASVPLAAAVNAPILLTANPASGLEPEVAAELERLNVGKVFVMGGSAVISAGIESSLGEKYGTGNVTRIYGKDRYGTSIASAEKLLEVRKSKGEGGFENVYFCSAANFPDALAVSPVAGIEMSPVLYAPPKGKLTGASANNAMAEYVGGLSITGKATVIGGSGAVSDEALAEIQTLLGQDVKRLKGSNRYDTMLAIWKEYSTLFTNKSLVCVATGTNFPDALAGAALAAKKGSPIILVGYKDTDAVATSIRDFVKAQGITDSYVFGGTGAVSDDQMAMIYRQTTIG